jgi:hypothetical protein
VNTLLNSIFGKKFFSDYRGILVIGGLAWVGFTIYKSKLEITKLEQEVKKNETDLQKKEMYKNFGIKS